MDGGGGVLYMYYTGGDWICTRWEEVGITRSFKIVEFRKFSGGGGIRQYDIRYE